MGSNQTKEASFDTQVLPVDTTKLGKFVDRETLEQWELPEDTSQLEPLHKAAKLLKSSNIPVGFPTETVYGLGADATRSDAVKGIYKAKGRPSDNPLIIHICDLTMLRSLLTPAKLENGDIDTSIDPIPEIYKPLIKRFWPGPLTILLPNPTPSKLAPEVTAGLPSFGARMTDSPLALSLIKLTGVPIAAPSANASTKPSPTQATHVLHDLNGKIELILDGGACQVGVESTVVDGTCSPPVVLRPGGVSIDEIRECQGWKNVTKGYKDQSQIGDAAPRAPGMKYKHYSPKAKVVLFEAIPTKGSQPDLKKTTMMLGEGLKIHNARFHKEPHLGLELLDRPFRIGIVRTRHWQQWAGLNYVVRDTASPDLIKIHPQQDSIWGHAKISSTLSHRYVFTKKSPTFEVTAELIEISLGTETKDIAHGLFSALRDLDQENADVIYVEGIEDEGDIAAAVMNRLRKAASVIVKER
ncbi:DHBP synthase RibB-like alpha/beta domain-containing protein [Tricladium varicosporioides]|nr:DHBP synthase RibB-like alpha/beta domain-containing protein [Hymenoscyphus varicosporioides]